MTRLAVLIDAENIPANIARALFEEVGRLGDATVRRMYGDFSAGRLAPWMQAGADHAIIPHQTVVQVAGKNAADIALVIDAMDLLHSRRFDGFCLVSSDSDFTRLATRIREEGLDVYGFGGQQTSAGFRQAFKRFHEMGVQEVPMLKTAPVSLPSTPARPAPPEAVVKLVCSALAETANGEGWAPLSSVGGRMLKLSPEFSVKAFGYAKLSSLIGAVPRLETKRDKVQQIVLRLRPDVD